MKSKLKRVVYENIKSCFGDSFHKAIWGVLIDSANFTVRRIIINSMYNNVATSISLSVNNSVVNYFVDLKRR